MPSDVIELAMPVVEVGPSASALMDRDLSILPTLLIKRSIDVAGALLALLIALPVLLIIATAVATDGGPVFYGHRRIGRGGQSFACLKFRTMRTDSDEVLATLLARDERAALEWAMRRKLRDDPRVTRVGRMLRVSSLDELPQLFNVLRGEMSLVGPRPVVQAELDQYYAGEAGASYLSVRPGLTGLWQVSGRSDVDYEDRVALDCAYVRDLSLGSDMRLLARTVGALMRRAGAY